MKTLTRRDAASDRHHSADRLFNSKILKTFKDGNKILLFVSRLIARLSIKLRANKQSFADTSNDNVFKNK